MSYWRDREEKHIKQSKRTDAQLSAQLIKNQNEAMKDIQQQIDAFYGRYATKEGITMAEARKRASKLDIEAYGEKAKRYVGYAHSDNPLIQAEAFTDRANEEMRLYNLTMKANRLELLKANINLEVIKMSSADEHFLTEKFTKGARAEYKRQAGILGETLTHSAKSLEKVVNASFLNATWSERLWVNQQALRAELDKLLNRGIIQGKNPKALASDLRKKFDVSKSDADRLLITEMARIQLDVQADAFKRMGVDMYEYIAEPTACKICKPLDGEKFKLEDVEPGVNAHPMHPRCRCSISPAVDREAWEADLRRRGL